jgi:hypothetical protein
LAYGAAGEAVAILAAVLLGRMTRLPEGLLSLVLGWAAYFMLLFPSLAGSSLIAIAIGRLTGSPADNVDLFVPLLWAVAVIQVLVLVLRAVTRRATVRR